MRFLCVSDIHGKASKLPALLERERPAGIDCILVAGDMTEFGGSREVEKTIRPLMEAGVPLFAVHGNMDTEGALRFIEDSGISIHGKTISTDGVSITGIGGSNPTPMLTPTEYTEPEIARILDCSNPGKSGGKHRILVSHAPPFNTRLDVITSGAHVGSTTIREYVLRENIRLCVSGHIHESRGIDRIGECACVNAGAFFMGKYCIINFDTDSGESVIELKEVK